MKLVGFNFTKIFIEKKSSKFKDLKINTSMNLKSIEESKQNLLKTGDQFLTIKFSYNINYEPGIAKIELEGTMVVSMDKKEAKEVLSQWKGKKLDEKYNLSFFNILLTKSNVKALELEEELNLPFHFKLPIISMGKQKKQS